MREIKLSEWGKSTYLPRKGIRRRPTPKWKLLDSIIYIKLRDKYLKKEGIIQELDNRLWRVNFDTIDITPTKNINSKRKRRDDRWIKK